MLAPWSSSSAAISVYPQYAASISAVRLSSVRASMSAPRRRSRATTAVCPRPAATSSGVNPIVLCDSRTARTCFFSPAAPAAPCPWHATPHNSSSTADDSPSAAARCSADPDPIVEACGSSMAAPLGCSPADSAVTTCPISPVRMAASSGVRARARGGAVRSEAATEEAPSRPAT